MTFIPAHRDATNDPALLGAPRAVYDRLIYELEPYQFRAISISEIAFALRVKRATVIKALRVLRVRGYLERGPGKDRRRLYFRLLVTPNPPKVPLGAPIPPPE